MAVQLDQNGKDDLKTQFITREGTYRLMTLSEYSRPNRVGYTSNQSSPQVRVSIVSLPTTSTAVLQSQPPPPPSVPPSACLISNGQDPNFQSGGGVGQGGDRICFNFGKELFVYAYRGVKKAADLSKPIDKKLYKGTNPSCHDFNATSATNEGAPLLVGFTTGQIQLVQPGKREPGKLYNEERLIDKTKVTCLKWLPGSPNLFLAAHSSGHLYLYNEELPCTPTVPNYQTFKVGEGYIIYTCKSKSTRNPLYKWTFGTDNCSINEFCFSPCGSNLAIVSQDGFLRVFHYDTMELLGIARSYFGGFLCVCWSPDGKYIVVGGEDDLVTVWSLNERRVVARGQGHRSWVSVVAFDPYTTSYSQWDGPDFSDDENPINDSGYNRCYKNGNDCHNNDIDSDNIPAGVGRRPNSSSFRDSYIAPDKLATSYRLGSVSQDTQLCLWDITEDVLRQPLGIRQRLSSHDPPVVNGEIGQCNDVKVIKPILTSATGTVASSSSGTVSVTIKDIENSNSNKCNNTGKTSGTGGGNNKVSNCSNSATPSETSSGRNSISNDNSKHLNSLNKNNSSNSGKSINVISNCVGNNIAGTINKSVIVTTDKDNNTSSEGGKSSSGSSSKSSSEQGISAFNTLTQRLSSLGFGSDKKSDSSSHQQQHHHNKKTFTLSKSSGNHNFLHNNNSSSDNNTSVTSLKGGKSSSTMTTGGNGGTTNIVSTYDPMKLIGTSACPRFDECPVLEPLVCKKIAHERLTALIFREDCFLTACQDGIIYTWARPGFSNVPQHMPSSPTAPPGGTVV